MNSDHDMTDSPSSRLLPCSCLVSSEGTVLSAPSQSAIPASAVTTRPWTTGAAWRREWELSASIHLQVRGHFIQSSVGVRLLSLLCSCDWIINTWQMTAILNRTFHSTSIKYKQYACVSKCVPTTATARSSRPLLAWEREAEIVFDGRGEIYSSQTVTWYAGSGQARLFAHNCSIIILSEICFCFHFSLYSSVCIFVCLWREAGTGDYRMKTDNAEDTQVHVCVCIRRGAVATASKREMQNMTALCVRVRLCVSMCSPVHVHLGGRKLRMRSKANNFIGGLHNSAAIPGVIVFPLRLSCRDESLMHSCLGIMDGMGKLLPSPAAGGGGRWRNEWGWWGWGSVRRTWMDCGQTV